jgi:hypothetical protein
LIPVKLNLQMPHDKERVKRVPGRASGIEKIEPSADRAIDRLVPLRGLRPQKGTVYGLIEEMKLGMWKGDFLS